MISVKPCGAEDFDSVIALLRQLWPEKVLDVPALRKVYDAALVSDRQRYVCAVDGQRIVGFGSLTIKSNLYHAVVGYVDELVVDDSYRGSGVGTLLLDHLTACAQARGCKRIELDCAFHRKDSHAFYERRGYQRRAYVFTKEL